MKSQDVVVLFKLLSIEQEQHGIFGAGGSTPYAVRNLEASLGISKTEVSASINRSIASSLAMRVNGRISPNRRNLLEFIQHGFRYVFPVRAGAPQRGVPTAFAAPMLENLLLGAGAEVYVWPHPTGRVRGLQIDPLFASVPEAAMKDDRLYEYLALADAIRIGKQRESRLAKSIFEKSVGSYDNPR